MKTHASDQYMSCTHQNRLTFVEKPPILSLGQSFLSPGQPNDNPAVSPARLAFGQDQARKTEKSTYSLCGLGLDGEFLLLQILWK